MFRDRLPQDPPARAQRFFDDRMARIFGRLPALNGFCVQRDLSVTELSLHTWPGLDRSHEVAVELRRLLDALVDERPDAVERLRGRAFARSFH